ncbi:MAG: tryptophan-rich sensory protein [Oscillospiraceae bacterium]|nr:tryptophan-rich sensory protein [Oscillospiraceae bacterium]
MSLGISDLMLSVGCCLASMTIAGSTASKKANKEWFDSLNHPDNSFMLKYMTYIGFGFYLIFGYVLYHLFIGNEIVSIILVITIILLMGLCPMLLYKTRNLKLFFVSNLIFLVLIPLLAYLLLQLSLLLAGLTIVYLLWFLYDLSYWYRLMKMNQ